MGTVTFPQAGAGLATQCGKVTVPFYDRARAAAIARLSA
jgi:hypothetical protein